MSTCDLDHTVESVVQKLESQKEFLGPSLYEELRRFLTEKQNQETLNELFHLLKKYDLSSVEKQEERNQKMSKLISQ